MTFMHIYLLFFEGGGGGSFIDIPCANIRILIQRTYNSANQRNMSAYPLGISLDPYDTLL